MKYLFLFFSIIIVVASQRVLLRDITSITLRRGDYTTGRRSSPVPQLQCVGGTARGQFAPKVVQCYNRGFDGIDVQWECQAEMSSDYQFGKISVSCEGYDSPNDPFILAGSCGLKYEMDYTAQGARKGAFGSETPYESGTNYTNLVYFGIIVFVLYIVYITMTAPREGNEGDRFRESGFDHGPGYPPGGPPPPPGWRPHDPPPPYNESYKGSHSSQAGNQTGQSGPGFFTGLGLGALGGYFAGNTYNSGPTYRRRRGPSQFESDTGFHSDYGTSSFNDRRSSPGPSTSSHTSSGFGGTERR